MKLKDWLTPACTPLEAWLAYICNVTATGARSWILRYTSHKTGKDGKSRTRRDVGLGGYPGVSLAKARLLASELKESLANGQDPIDHKKAVQKRFIEDARLSKTFKEAAIECHVLRASEFRNPKHAAQWLSTLEAYAFPAFGNLQVSCVGVGHIRDALADIWLSKHETATRVRQRIANVLDFAKAQGIRSGDNPADLKGSLGELLPKSGSIRKKQGKKHYPRVPIDETPAFMLDLRSRQGVSARALEFGILTASRPGNVIKAIWTEIDLEAGLWTIPGEKMKAGLKHVVPLSSPALKILRTLSRKNNLVFPAPRGGELTDMALSTLIKKMSKARGGKYVDPDQGGRIGTPHATARSSFKDWSLRSTSYRLNDSTKSSFPDEWGELALAHVNNDATRAAYARDGLLTERKILMNAWTEFLGG